MAFQRAVRQQAFIKLAVTGPTGSGKTYSALRLAFGLGDRVAIIDTENRSGRLYAGIGKDGIREYDTADIEPPFAVEKYTEAIHEAVAAGYQVLIIDSLSHAWAGSGGLLEQKDDLDARGAAGDRNNKNRFTNWGPITKKYEALNSVILQAPLHVIACLRSKMEYQADGSGKVTKLGMAPVGRDGIEYEFTIVFDVASSHAAVASKDRTGLFPHLSEMLTERHGRQIREWLESGAPVTDPAPSAPQQQQASPASNGSRQQAPPPPADAAPAVNPATLAATKCRDLYLALCKLNGADPKDPNARLKTWDSLLGRGWPTEPTLEDWEVLAMVLTGEIERLNAGADPFAEAPPAGALFADPAVTEPATAGHAR